MGIKNHTIRITFLQNVVGTLLLFLFSGKLSTSF